MSIARLSTLLSLLLGLISIIAIHRLPVSVLSLLDEGKPSGLGVLISGDPLVRMALALAMFGLVFGLVSLLCHFAMVSRPLAAAGERLRAETAHGGTINAADCLSIITQLSNFRLQLAPVRAHLASASMVGHPAQILPSPVGALVPANSLADRATPHWVSRLVVASLVAAAFVLLVWGIATGANTQAASMFDPNAGHPAGLLIGTRSGGIAFILVLVGAVICLGLTRTGLEMARREASNLLSALDAAAVGRAARIEPFTESGLLELKQAAPDGQLQLLVDQMGKAQSAQTKHLEKIVAAITSQLQAIPGALSGVATSLVENRDMLESRSAARHEIEGSLWHETTRALMDLRLALEGLQHTRAATPMAMAANSAVAERLSSAMRNLAEATELKTGTE